MDFSVNPVGIEFQLFGPAHLATLGLIILVNLGLLPLRHVRSNGVHRAVRLGLASIIMTASVGFAVWRLWAGGWDIRTDLPLHLCDVMAIVTVALLVTRHRRLYDFVYFLGIGGAAQALLTSNVGAYGYPHVYFVSSMAAHGAIVTTGLYLAVVEGYRPTWRTLWWVAGCGTVYAAAIFGLNLVLGSNYLFIGHKPEFRSIIDWLGPWPWYVPALIAIGVAVLHVLYLPFVWQDWRERR